MKKKVKSKVSFRLSSDLKRRLQDNSKSTRRSMTAIVELALEKFL